MRIPHPLVHTAILTFVIGSALSAQAVFDKVMLTEVSWGDPDGVEITNFSSSAQDLTGWRIHWRQGVDAPTISDPLDVVLAPNEILVVIENTGGVASEVPADVVVLTSLPSVPTTTQALLISLVDQGGQTVDVVRISDTTGSSPVAAPGFRGLAVRGVVSGFSGAVGVERIWGLDSDAGDDWTEQPDRSFGTENRNSGPRGTDPFLEPELLINEIDINPDYVELRNVSGLTLDLQGYFLLYCDRQGDPIERSDPFPGSFVLADGDYLVLGAGPTPPPELPSGGTYIQAFGPYLGNDEFALGLYDEFGQCLDLVRAPALFGNAVHNHPRLPAPWDAFVGAAGRGPSGDAAIARSALTDTDTGTDWNPVWSRTMGSANSGFSSSSLGLGQVLDVRVNEGRDDGLTVIINAGASAAGGTHHFFLSLGHSHGLGPFFGLGADALANWSATYGVAPFAGILDARGSARWDFPASSLPPSFDADFVFYIQAPGLLRLTPVLEFDT